MHNRSTGSGGHVAMSGVKVQNWKRSITYYASSVETVESVDDIVRIVSDTARYPSPVRAKGSHHSTTRCIVDDTLNDTLRKITSSGVVSTFAGAGGADGTGTAAQFYGPQGLAIDVSGNLYVADGR